MDRQPCRRCRLSSVMTVLVLSSLLIGLVQPSSIRALPPDQTAPSTPALQVEPLKPAPPEVAKPDPSAFVPVVGYSVRNDTSSALRTMPPISPKSTTREAPPLLPIPRPGQIADAQLPAADPVLQIGAGINNMPTPLYSFDGLANLDGVLPPDTQGDIGYDPSTGKKYYVQWVNLSFAIWDVTISPTLVFGPATGDTIWQGFGGPCQDNNDGDPITLFDPIAKRWIMSQFALPNYPSGPFYQCLACSKTADPTGEWYRYEFQVHTTKMNDYPKFGMWPDAYYMTVNQFTNGSSWGGAGVFAFDRDKILAGQAASFVYFDLYNLNSNYGGMLPADLDGDTLPPAGAPGIFAEVDRNWSGTNDILSLFNFHVDWVTPANSTFTLVNELPVAEFAYICTDSRSCIPQKGTTQKLDAISDRLMYRLQYRNFGDHQALVTNHTVDAGGGRVGVRWYELRSTGGAWSLYQQGTFAPNDGLYRWMGSVALDSAGNMALGYSVSGSTIYPSIRYTGRLVSDTLGQMTQGESTLVDGTGNQTSTSARWGDYSMMGVDPQDDCTCWYTQEYIKTSGLSNWSTRIGSFRFPNCAKPFEGAITGQVVNNLSGTPIGQATVVAALNPTTTFSSLTSDQGNYHLDVSAGAYTVTVGAFGYITSTPTRVTVTTGLTATFNVSLTAAAFYTVSGYVKDAEAGWPLYAELVIDGYPAGSVWTDPVTGYYAISLSSVRAYRFQATAFVNGYGTISQTVGPLTGTSTANFNLPSVDCAAPGRELRGISADFSTGLPSGWTIVNNAVPGALWRFDDPGLRGNLTGGEGDFAIIDSDDAGEVEVDTELRTAVFNFSALITVQLQFKYDFNWYSTGLAEIADVDVSLDAGLNWENVWRRQASDRGPKTANIDISDLAAGQDQVMVRFHYYNANYEWWWQIDDVVIGEGGCLLPSGGLVVGNIYDGNTELPLNGAQVSSDDGSSTLSVGSPEPVVSDGFYVLFASAGARTITASLAGGYEPAVVQTHITPSTTQRVDLYLDAGRLVVSPAAYTATILIGSTAVQTMTISNTGSAPATFELRELSRTYTALGPYERPNSVIKPFKQSYASAQRLKLASPIFGSPFIAGDVLTSWDTGLDSAWGIAYDSFDDTVWVSSPASGWGGENRIVEYLTNGTATGRSHSFTWNPAAGPADLAFNQNTGTLWLMNVDDGAGCIYEINPATGYTGNTICPGESGFSVSQRGLAYDPTTDTWYAGSWNDSMVYHFGSDGTILDQVDVGLSIAGLAYNPDTQHLFVIVSADPNPLYVLDAANGYANLGQFTVTGLTGYSGAGLELDCAGNLWLVDQNTLMVYQVESGETTSVCYMDIPWLSISPITGTLATSTSQTVQITFDAGVPEVEQPGTYQGQIKVVNGTPYQVENIPVTLIVQASAELGRLVGTVIGLGRCDISSTALAGALVVVEMAGGITRTLTTDTQGRYSIWLLASVSPVTVTVSADNHQSTQITGITLTQQQTSTVDLSLRLLEACVSALPQAISISQTNGVATSLPLTLTNTGAASATFKVYEIQADNLGLSPQSGASRLSLFFGDAPDYVLSLDDGSAEDSIGLTNGGQFVWLNRFTPADGDFPISLQTISVNFPNTTLVGDNMELAVWEDTDGDGDPGTGATLLYTQVVTVPNNTGVWNDYILAEPVVLSGPGDVLIGVINRSGEMLKLDYPAAIDTSSSQQRSWVGIYSGEPPEPPTLPPDDTWAMVDSLGFTGNWMIRASGEQAMQDVPWLSEQPITGTIGADAQIGLLVTLDASDVHASGIYTAGLTIRFDGSRAYELTIPVTMTVSFVQNVFLSRVSK